MAISKFTLENGLQVTGSSNFSGTVSSSGGFTGSLYGTASYGQDSNLLDGLDSTAFARLASANIFTQTQTVSGNLFVTASLSASALTASAITGSTLSYTTLNTTQMTSSGKILVDNGLKIGNGANSYATNIGIGDSALASINNPVGVDNVAIGYQALASNQSGNQNVAIGKYALYNTNGAYNNVAIGGGAGQANTTGNENIFIGVSAGNGAKASFNSLIGTQAGTNLVSSQNTAIGYFALNAHKGTNGNNFALGTYAAQTVISGTENVAIGVNTIYGITNGDYNIAIGSRAIYPSAQGYNNVTSSYNTAIGYNSLSTIVSGNNNLSVGYSATSNLLTGSFNSAIGGVSLGSLKTGSSNTVIGYLALQNMSTGSNNIAIGYQVGSSIVTGSGNVIIGNATGINNTDNNIYIADGAGNLRLRVDSNGALSGTVITGSSITGSTVLATVVTGTTTTGSTALFTTITGSNISGTNNLYVGANIGIATTVPNTQVAINNTTTPLYSPTYGLGIGVGAAVTDLTLGTDATYGYLQTWNSKPLYLNNQGQNIILGSSTTNVSVGTASANYKLDVSGTGRFTNNVEITGTLKGLTQLTSSAALVTSLTGTTTSGSTALFGVVTGSNINTNWIQFPASQVASSDVNTLDDYEEGFWIPAFSGSTTTNFTYDTAATSGSYVKIGKNVSLNGYIKISSTGSSVGNLYIQSLPFAIPAGVVNYYSLNVGYHASLSATVAAPEGYGVLGSSVIALYKNTLGSATQMAVTDLTNAASVMFSINYNVS